MKTAALLSPEHKPSAYEGVDPYACIIVSPVCPRTLPATPPRTPQAAHQTSESIFTNNSDSDSNQNSSTGSDHTSSDPTTPPKHTQPKRIEWTTPAIDTALMELLALLQAQYSIDKRRVYLLGMSMGGLGTWMCGARHPEIFAALVPICGGGVCVCMCVCVCVCVCVCGR